MNNLWVLTSLTFGYFLLQSEDTIRRSLCRFSSNFFIIAGGYTTPMGDLEVIVQLNNSYRNVKEKHYKALSKKVNNVCDRGLTDITVK